MKDEAAESSADTRQHDDVHMKQEEEDWTTEEYRFHQAQTLSTF